MATLEGGNGNSTTQNHFPQLSFLFLKIKVHPFEPAAGLVPDMMAGQRVSPDHALSLYLLLYPSLFLYLDLRLCTSKNREKGVYSPVPQAT